MIKYDVHSRKLTSTGYGRIASHCYITVQSMAVYLSHIHSHMHDVHLFRTFAMSHEFAGLSVRAEEQAQVR